MLSLYFDEIIFMKVFIFMALILEGSLWHLYFLTGFHFKINTNSVMSIDLTSSYISSVKLYDPFLWIDTGHLSQG